MSQAHMRGALRLSAPLRSAAQPPPVLDTPQKSASIKQARSRRSIAASSRSHGKALANAGLVTEAPRNAYRGGWVDTFRGTVLTQLLSSINQQGSSAGWTYIDYSAGPDKWDISHSVRRQWGVNPVFDYGRAMSVLRHRDERVFMGHPFLGLMRRVREVNDEVEHRSSARVSKLTPGFKYFPSTAALLKPIMRPQDRAILCEKDPEFFHRLANYVGQDPRFKLYNLDVLEEIAASEQPSETTVNVARISIPQKLTRGEKLLDTYYNVVRKQQMAAQKALAAKRSSLGPGDEPAWVKNVHPDVTALESEVDAALEAGELSPPPHIAFASEIAKSSKLGNDMLKYLGLKAVEPAPAAPLLDESGEEAAPFTTRTLDLPPSVPEFLMPRREAFDNDSEFETAKRIVELRTEIARLEVETHLKLQGVNPHALGMTIEQLQSLPQDQQRAVMERAAVVGATPASRVRLSQQAALATLQAQLQAEYARGHWNPDLARDYAELMRHVDDVKLRHHFPLIERIMHNETDEDVHEDDSAPVRLKERLLPKDILEDITDDRMEEMEDDLIAYDPHTYDLYESLLARIKQAERTHKQKVDNIKSQIRIMQQEQADDLKALQAEQKLRVDEALALEDLAALQKRVASGDRDAVMLAEAAQKAYATALSKRVAHDVSVQGPPAELGLVLGQSDSQLLHNVFHTPSHVLMLPTSHRVNGRVVMDPEAMELADSLQEDGISAEEKARRNDKLQALLAKNDATFEQNMLSGSEPTPQQLQQVADAKAEGHLPAATDVKSIAWDRLEPENPRLVAAREAERRRLADLAVETRAFLQAKAAGTPVQQLEATVTPEKVRSRAVERASSDAAKVKTYLEALEGWARRSVDTWSAQAAKQQLPAPLTATLRETLQPLLDSIKARAEARSKLVELVKAHGDYPPEVKEARAALQQLEETGKRAQQNLYAAVGAIFAQISEAAEKRMDAAAVAVRVASLKRPSAAEEAAVDAAEDEVQFTASVFNVTTDPVLEHARLLELQSNPDVDALHADAEDRIDITQTDAWRHQSLLPLADIDDSADIDDADREEIDEEDDSAGAALPEVSDKQLLQQLREDAELEQDPLSFSEVEAQLAADEQAEREEKLRELLGEEDGSEPLNITDLNAAEQKELVEHLAKAEAAEDAENAEEGEEDEEGNGEPLTPAELKQLREDAEQARKEAIALEDEIAVREQLAPYYPPDDAPSEDPDFPTLGALRRRDLAIFVRAWGKSDEQLHEEELEQGILEEEGPEELAAWLIAKRDAYAAELTEMREEAVERMEEREEEEAAGPLSAEQEAELDAAEEEEEGIAEQDAADPAEDEDDFLEPDLLDIALSEDADSKAATEERIARLQRGEQDPDFASEVPLLLGEDSSANSAGGNALTASGDAEVDDAVAAAEADAEMEARVQAALKRINPKWTLRDIETVEEEEALRTAGDEASLLEYVARQVAERSLVRDAKARLVSDLLVQTRYRETMGELDARDQDEGVESVIQSKLLPYLATGELEFSQDEQDYLSLLQDESGLVTSDGELDALKQFNENPRHLPPQVEEFLVERVDFEGRQLDEEKMAEQAEEEGVEEDEDLDDEEKALLAEDEVDAAQLPADAESDAAAETAAEAAEAKTEQRALDVHSEGEDALDADGEGSDVFVDENEEGEEVEEEDEPALIRAEISELVEEGAIATDVDRRELIEAMLLRESVQHAEEQLADDLLHLENEVMDEDDSVESEELREVYQTIDPEAYLKLSSDEYSELKLRARELSDRLVADELELTPEEIDVEAERKVPDPDQRLRPDVDGVPWECNSRNPLAWPLDIYLFDARRELEQLYWTNRFKTPEEAAAARVEEISQLPEAEMDRIERILLRMRTELLTAMNKLREEQDTAREEAKQKALVEVIAKRDAAVAAYDRAYHPAVAAHLEMDDARIARDSLGSLLEDPPTVPELSVLPSEEAERAAAAERERVLRARYELAQVYREISELEGILQRDRDSTLQYDFDVAHQHLHIPHERRIVELHEQAVRLQQELSDDPWVRAEVARRKHAEAWPKHTRTARWEQLAESTGLPALQAKAAEAAARARAVESKVGPRFVEEYNRWNKSESDLLSLEDEAAEARYAAQFYTEEEALALNEDAADAREQENRVNDEDPFADGWMDEMLRDMQVKDAIERLRARATEVEQREQLDERTRAFLQLEEDALNKPVSELSLDEQESLLGPLRLPPIRAGDPKRARDDEGNDLNLRQFETPDPLYDRQHYPTAEAWLSALARLAQRNHYRQRRKEDLNFLPANVRERIPQDPNVPQPPERVKRTDDERQQLLMEADAKQIVEGAAKAEAEGAAALASKKGSQEKSGKSAAFESEEEPVFGSTVDPDEEAYLAQMAEFERAELEAAVRAELGPLASDKEVAQKVARSQLVSWREVALQRELTPATLPILELEDTPLCVPQERVPALYAELHAAKTEAEQLRSTVEETLRMMREKMEFTSEHSDAFSDVDDLHSLEHENMLVAELQMARERGIQQQAAIAGDKTAAASAFGANTSLVSQDGAASSSEAEADELEVINPSDELTVVEMLARTVPVSVAIAENRALLNDPEAMRDRADEMEELVTRRERLVDDSEALAEQYQNEMPPGIKRAVALVAEDEPVELSPAQQALQDAQAAGDDAAIFAAQDAVEAEAEQKLQAELAREEAGEEEEDDVEETRSEEEKLDDLEYLQMVFLRNADLSRPRAALREWVDLMGDDEDSADLEAMQNMPQALRDALDAQEAAIERGEEDTEEVEDLENQLPEDSAALDATDPLNTHGSMPILISEEMKQLGEYDASVAANENAIRTALSELPVAKFLEGQQRVLKATLAEQEALLSESQRAQRDAIVREWRAKEDAEDAAVMKSLQTDPKGSKLTLAALELTAFRRRQQGLDVSALGPVLERLRKEDVDSAYVEARRRLAEADAADSRPQDVLPVRTAPKAPPPGATIASRKRYETALRDHKSLVEADKRLLELRRTQREAPLAFQILQLRRAEREPTAARRRALLEQHDKALLEPVQKRIAEINASAKDGVLSDDAQRELKELNQSTGEKMALVDMPSLDALRHELWRLQRAQDEAQTARRGARYFDPKQDADSLDLAARKAAEAAEEAAVLAQDMVAADEMPPVPEDPQAARDREMAAKEEAAYARIVEEMHVEERLNEVGLSPNARAARAQELHEEAERRVIAELYGHLPGRVPGSETVHYTDAMKYELARLAKKDKARGVLPPEGQSAVVSSADTHFPVNIAAAIARPLTAHAIISIDVAEGVTEGFGTEGDIQSVDDAVLQSTKHILDQSLHRFPHATYVITYPIFGRGYQDQLMAHCARSGVRQILQGTFHIQKGEPFDTASRVYDFEPWGTGVIIIRPPPGFDKVLKDIVNTMQDVMVAYGPSIHTQEEQEAVASRHFPPVDAQAKATFFVDQSIHWKDGWPNRPDVSWMTPQPEEHIRALHSFRWEHFVPSFENPRSKRFELLNRARNDLESDLWNYSRGYRGDDETANQWLLLNKQLGSGPKGKQRVDREAEKPEKEVNKLEPEFLGEKPRVAQLRRQQRKEALKLQKERSRIEAELLSLTKGDDIAMRLSDAEADEERRTVMALIRRIDSEMEPLTTELEERVAEIEQQLLEDARPEALAQLQKQYDGVTAPLLKSRAELEAQLAQLETRVLDADYFAERTSKQLEALPRLVDDATAARLTSEATHKLSLLEAQLGVFDSEMEARLAPLDPADAAGRAAVIDELQSRAAKFHAERARINSSLDTLRERLTDVQYGVQLSRGVPRVALDMNDKTAARVRAEMLVALSRAEEEVRASGGLAEPRARALERKRGVEATLKDLDEREHVVSQYHKDKQRIDVLTNQLKSVRARQRSQALRAGPALDALQDGLDAETLSAERLGFQVEDLQVQQRAGRRGSLTQTPPVDQASLPPEQRYTTASERPAIDSVHTGLVLAQQRALQRQKDAELAAARDAKRTQVFNLLAHFQQGKLDQSVQAAAEEEARRAAGLGVEEEGEEEGEVRKKRTKPLHVRIGRNSRFLLEMTRAKQGGYSQLVVPRSRK